MFSVFPAMLVYYLFGAFILRIAAAVTLFYFAKQHIVTVRKTGTEITQTYRYIFWILAAFEVVVGALLFIGLYTQVAALAGMAIAVALKMFYFLKAPVVLHTKATYFLLFMICFALIFLGAGAFAFDLPL